MMTKEQKFKIVELLEEMRPGDQIVKVKRNGKIGFELKNKTETIFVQTGEYGYFESY